MRKWTQEEVECWNAGHKPGDACRLRLDTGELVETKLRSSAWRLPHGVAIVKLDGYAGGWDMERVQFDAASEVHDSAVLWQMRVNGGGFISALAEAGFRADSVNLAKIKAAWPQDWAAYRKMAQAGKEGK